MRSARQQVCSPERVRACFRPKQGQSIVEVQMALPILLLILLGIIEFALALHTIIDFSGAVSNGVRQATVVGTNATNDDSIGQAMFQTMRADDPDRTNYFDIQLVQSRAITDTSSNTYENFYAYNTATNSFNVDPYAYIQNVLAPQGSAPTPCQYFYEAHKVNDVDDPSNSTVYLDQSEQLSINPLASGDPYGLGTHLASAITNASLLAGCGRIYDVDYGTGAAPDGNTAYNTTSWTCANDGASAPGITGHLCYYYPEERVNTMDPLLSDDTSLTDELEVDLNYTYRPLENFVTANSPLGLGFTLTEHARGRVEATSATN